MIKRLNIYYWLRKIFVSRFAQKYLNQNFVRKFIFFLIYKTNHWNKYEKVDKNNLLVSGPGSLPGSVQTKNIIDNLDLFIKKNNIQSMLDMPCGDFSWMQDLIKKNNSINYTGYDIVEDIISYNNKKYSKNNVSFFCKDIINEKNFDNFDLVFIRDFFIHIDNACINILLKNIKSSKVRFLACSNNNNDFNKDVVVGRYRNVNLTIKPFYMKEIFHTFSEGVDGCSINIYKIS